MALYLSARGDGCFSVATFAQALAAISQAHMVVDHKSPSDHRGVREILVSADASVSRRTRSNPVSARELRAMTGALPGVWWATGTGRF